MWLQEGISTIITAIKRSHMIFRRLETYLTYRIASSLIILGRLCMIVFVIKWHG